MRFVALDLETFYSDDYTLKKMTQEAYIRDPRFEAHGAAIKWGKDYDAKWYPERQLRSVLANEDWSDVYLICHHHQFDGLILSHHYRVRPRMRGCTLSMARLVLGNHISVSLDSVRKEFGLPEKTTPYNLFKGKHWHELTPDEQEKVAAGACDEVESIWKIFGELHARGFPQEELELIHHTLNMFCEPVLQGDIPLLVDIWQKEHDRKRDLLFDLNVTAEQLQSSEQFAQLLRDAGVEPEEKPGKNRSIYAFAKTDDFMKGLLEDEDDYVRELAEARLGIKSSLLQTRAETLARMASRGPMCVYLYMYGAHTTRWSGGDAVNLQNLPARKPEGRRIRQALKPPPGYRLVKPDLSQVECRLLNFLAGQTDVIANFRNGHDPYIGIASHFYGRPITKNEPNERGVGKQLELSCGYGCGAAKFKRTAANGTYGPPVEMSLEEADRAVKLYRQTHAKVVHYWGEAEWILTCLANGKTTRWGPMSIINGRVWLPNGCMLHYDTLNYYTDPDTGEVYWRVKKRSGWTKIYGAKLAENCLSGASLVLTHRGWQYIATVQSNDLLWDGSAWVKHQGIVFRGIQETALLNGVRMTADHRVLTKHGWIRAAQAEGLQRAEVRLPDCYPRCWDNGAETPLVATLRVWKRIEMFYRAISFQSDAILRLYEKSIDQQSFDTTWDVATSGVCSLVFNDRPLSTAFASSLEKLWWTGYSRLQTMATDVRKFLGRYGAYLPTGFDYRTKKQCERLQPEQLRMGRSISASAQSSNQSDYTDTVGADNCKRSSKTFRDWGDDFVLSNRQPMAAGSVVYQTRFYEPTYDIMNCGPRRRFTVLGNDGPFLVHNCTQALARVLVSQAFLRIAQLGYRVVNTEHDSLWILVPDDGSVEHERVILEEMRREPRWLPGIPLDAEIN